MALALAIAVGESPFHVRGSTYAGMVTYANKYLPGGYAALVESIEDPELRSFAEHVFLPVAWYDVLPLIDLSRELARLEGRSVRDSVKRRAAFIAERDVTGLYRVLLRIVSPEFAMNRLQKAACRYFDFGVAEELETGTGYSKGRFGKLPVGLTDWFGPMLEGYAGVVLRMAGATAPQITVGEPRPDGARNGFRTVAFDVEFRWT
jgi:hypothetical protein